MRKTYLREIKDQAARKRDEKIMRENEKAADKIRKKRLQDL